MNYHGEGEEASGPIADVYEGGDTIVRKDDQTILYGQEKKEVYEPFFMKHIKKHGFNENDDPEELKRFAEAEDKDEYFVQRQKKIKEDEIEEQRQRLRA